MVLKSINFTGKRLTADLVKLGHFGVSTLNNVKNQQNLFATSSLPEIGSNLFFVSSAFQPLLFEAALDEFLFNCHLIGK